jgi:hypothetical protein
MSSQPDRTTSQPDHQLIRCDTCNEVDPTISLALL